MVVGLKERLPVVYAAILLICFLCFQGCATHTAVKIEVINELDQSKKQKVAVLDFKPDLVKKKNGSKPFVVGLFNNPDAGYLLANMFSQELSVSDMFDVVDRQTVIEKLEASGYSDVKSITDYGTVGKILEVDAIITGTFKRFGFIYPTIIPRIIVKFNTEYIDLKTNKRIWHLRIKGQ
ncbi:MAG: CsgG/HfaB family protein, partial [Candidatus Anammoxibacter sp.]